MNNFEHIDDYLTNRLNPQEKTDFEKQLESDGALRADVEFQKLTIDAIKHARMVELKTMLNNVPVGGSGFSTGLTAKIAGGVATVALIGSIAYFSLQRDSKITEPALSEAKTEEANPVNSDNTASSDTVSNSVADIEPPKPLQQEGAPAASAKMEIKKQEQSVTAFKEPKIDVMDLSDEVTSDKKKSDVIPDENHKPEVTASRIEVNTDASNKKYSFHYQFNNGKLLLYGSFDKGLYEILEINGNNHNVFLFYQENYYLLEEKENTTSPLVAVKDPVLLRKLKEYRAR